MVAEERAAQLEVQLATAHSNQVELRGIRAQLEASLVSAQAQIHANTASHKTLVSLWQAHHTRQRAAVVIQRAWRARAVRVRNEMEEKMQRVLVETQAQVGAMQQQQGVLKRQHANELAWLGRWMVGGGADALAGSADALLRAFVLPKKELARGGGVGGGGGGGGVSRRLLGGDGSGRGVLSRLHRVCCCW